MAQSRRIGVAFCFVPVICPSAEFPPMRRNPTTFALALVVVSLAVFTACAARTPHEVNTFARVDTTAARLTELELERITLLATATEGASLRDVEAGIAQLHARLHEFPNHASAERVVISRLILALDARESAVSSRLEQLRFVYTEKYPIVVQAATEARLLRERKAELRQPGH